MLTQEEFEELINDSSKTIEEDITWQENETHYPAVEFRVEVISHQGYPIFIHGSYNSLVRTLSYAIIHRGTGRIYALDLGKSHRNPDGKIVGEIHKHRWHIIYKDKQAYVPPDITTSINEPIQVWQEFCAESNITHNGSMQDPPTLQSDPFLLL